MSTLIQTTGDDREDDIMDEGAFSVQRLRTLPVVSIPITGYKVNGDLIEWLDIHSLGGTSAHIAHMPYNQFLKTTELLKNTSDLMCSSNSNIRQKTAALNSLRCNHRVSKTSNPKP
jgi:hypothetical protein